MEIEILVDMSVVERALIDRDAWVEKGCMVQLLAGGSCTGVTCFMVKNGLTIESRGAITLNCNMKEEKSTFS